MAGGSSLGVRQLIPAAIYKGQMQGSNKKSL